MKKLFVAFFVLTVVLFTAPIVGAVEPVGPPPEAAVPFQEIFCRLQTVFSQIPLVGPILESILGFLAVLFNVDLGACTS